MPAARIARPLALALLVSLVGIAPAAAPSPAPAKTPEKVDFERHIMGLLGRLGCNTGSCHGSFQGKGGFRLSLFGYDPEMDYTAMTRDIQGRRVNPTNPDSSLLLLKATGQVDHGGLRRFGKDSWQYKMFRDWIVAGMPRTPGSGQVKKITISPEEVAVKKVGDTAQLTIKALFADGVEEDITSLCDYRTNDENVAVSSSMGLVNAKQAGDTAIIVSYRGSILPVRVMVPMTPPPGFKYTRPVEVNILDKLVYEKLGRLNIAPAELSDDAEFLRRVTIDTIGSLPTPEEVRTFLADKSANKREKKIDELLKHPRHAALWATKFSDITGNSTTRLENPQQNRVKLSQMWHDWFRKRIADNMPYDQIVKGVLTATSRDGLTPEKWAERELKLRDEMAKGFQTSYPERNTLDLYWRRQQAVPIEVWAEQTAVAFMGVRLECAQCHKHPFDRWTQDDYWGFANLFSTVTLGVSPDGKKAIDEANAKLREQNPGKNPNVIGQLREVFSATTARVRPNPTTNTTPKPKAPGGPEIPLSGDPRVKLFEWLSSPENPFFARSFVNRVWGHYFGIGIVHPVDDFSLANPSSNDKLLDTLAREFTEGKYDIRKIEKLVLMSRTYQQSSSRNPTNKLDNRSYARSYVRPLMAEVVVDIISDAMGLPENLGNDLPSGARAIEIGSTTVVNPQLREAFRVFGRSPRALACDCERATEPTVAHKLYLMADPGLHQKVLQGQTRARKMVDAKKSNEEIVEELFLATLSRFPTAEEKEVSLKRLSSASAKQTGANDILWALLNTTEFIFNH